MLGQWVMISWSHPWQAVQEAGVHANPSPYGANGGGYISHTLGGSSLPLSFRLYRVGSRGRPPKHLQDLRRPYSRIFAVAGGLHRSGSDPRFSGISVRGLWQWTWESFGSWAAPKRAPNLALLLHGSLRRSDGRQADARYERRLSAGEDPRWISAVGVHGYCTLTFSLWNASSTFHHFLIQSKIVFLHFMHILSFLLGIPAYPKICNVNFFG